MDLIDNRKVVTKNDKKVSNYFKKIKNIKNIELIIGIFILAIVILCYATYSSRKNEPAETETMTYSYLDTESKLAEVLSEIKGVGKVSVMITYDGTTKLVTAESISTVSNSKTDNSGGASYTSSNLTETITPVISNSEALVLKEMNPEILGVVVVAEGAENISVKLELLRVTSTVLGIDPKLIAVSAAN